MSARDEARDWAEAVAAIGRRIGARYEPVGGINPRGAPAALCPGGTNRLTGRLGEELWGASCDALEHEEGGFLRKAVLPRGVLVKAHMPDLARTLPPFNVESVEASPADLLDRRSRLRVRFESIEFNRRFIATVPSGHDPIAVRELFGPAFIDWATTIDREVDFGLDERQLYLLWRLRERSGEEYARALAAGDELFARVRRELREAGAQPYEPGPWHAGLEPFPGSEDG